MKKLVLVMLAIFLVVPALGNAGSVSSRYDVTFGGFVKFDFGWSSDSGNADPAFAFRDSRRGAPQFNDEFSNTFMTGAESRFNFLVKGPDLWGAKTSAFIEGDFRGVTTGNAHGGFQLRHAFMKMNWDSAELMIGQNWQQWGSIYYPAMLGANDYAMYLKGIRTPQIALRYFWTKEFNTMIGLTSATEWSGARGVRQVDDYSRSNVPGFMGEIAYWTDRCGKIGPHNLKFALSGYYGQEKYTWFDAINNRWTDDRANAWLTSFRYSIPIVPEKQGDKVMSLLLNGNFFYGQNAGGNTWLAPGTMFGSYARINAATGGVAVSAPTVFGLYSQVSWWVANNVHFNGMYGYAKYNMSSAARNNLGAAGAARIGVTQNNVNMQQTYGANVLWDANQAVRFGAQWMRIFTSYNGRNLVGTNWDSRSGTMDQYRIAAWYFF